MSDPKSPQPPPPPLERPLRFGLVAGGPHLIATLAPVVERLTGR